jgi:hypothetical protein
MTIIDVPFEPFVRRGENLVSYWNVSAAHTHYVGAKGNAGIERSLEVGVLSRKGIRYAWFITVSHDSTIPPNIFIAHTRANAVQYTILLPFKTIQRERASMNQINETMVDGYIRREKGE